ncbi:hypothetical protein [Rhizobium mayense]|uniref:Uncharacterized protein n=1 Tax=Rhizobium mayense TaxID=1312184 RepID=A0ABT7K5R2_9HYPH|nr:hypothetical protein [Rhizobium mayense]MDL2403942.1 hypothetical protein [Rhizobium mayense]
MTSRKAQILKWASDRTEELTETKVGRDPQYRQNCISIARVCLSLLDQKTPIKPTVPAIIEAGGLIDPNFRAASTIYNEYADFVRIWREAYQQIMNIGGEPGLGLEQLLARDLDLTDLDEGTASRVRHICVRSLELLQRYNALKEIITQTVPVDLDEGPEMEDSLIDDLLHWIQKVPTWGFDYNEYGLQVSRTTTAGTLIMDADLFEGLKAVAGGAKSKSAAVAALAAADGGT